MIIIVFALFGLVLLGSIYNCRDDSILLQQKYLYLKDTLYVTSAQIQHQASFENLDSNIVINAQNLGEYRPVYSFPFYMAIFSNHNSTDRFQYILNQPFELFIKDIPVTKKMIELYSNQAELRFSLGQISIESYNQFWPCFSAKMDDFIL